MARRVAAFLGMVGVIILMLLLMWKIHEHHGIGQPHDDEPTIVGFPAAGGRMSVGLRA